MNIKAAIFDMDGTLIDSLGIWEVIWEQLGREFLKKEGFRPKEEDDFAVRTMLYADAMDFIHEKYDIGKSGAELTDFSNKVFREFYSDEVELKPGVRSFLDHLKAGGTKMCIASATEIELVMLAIEHCELSPYFDYVLSCASVGAGKDKPDVFINAASILGEELSDTWVFEDSFVAIQTATEIGMPTVGIYDDNNFYQDKIKETATHYIEKGETLKKLI